MKNKVGVFREQQRHQPTETETKVKTTGGDGGFRLKPSNFPLPQCTTLLFFWEYNFKLMIYVLHQISSV